MAKTNLVNVEHSKDFIQEISALIQSSKQRMATLNNIYNFAQHLDFRDCYPNQDFKGHILREIEQFLLELGAGFTFIACQKRIQIDHDDFYIDWLFYNRKLKRLVA